MTVMEIFEKSKPFKSDKWIKLLQRSVGHRKRIITCESNTKRRKQQYRLTLSYKDVEIISSHFDVTKRTPLDIAQRLFELRLLNKDDFKILSERFRTNSLDKPGNLNSLTVAALESRRLNAEMYNPIEWLLERLEEAKTHRSSSMEFLLSLTFSAWWRRFLYIPGGTKSYFCFRLY